MPNTMTMTVAWWIACVSISAGAAEAVAPHAEDVAANVAKLRSERAGERAGAAEALGYLRDPAAAGALAAALGDRDALVRREAALALAWCGGRGQVAALLKALDDPDASVRQSAWVALTNLTGMEFPFDGHAADGPRRKRVARWRQWWSAVPAGKAPENVLALLPAALAGGGDNLAFGAEVTCSTVYKGPPESLTDGRLSRGPGGFWQTKNVDFPQHCTLDLARPREVGCVVVHHHGERFCMTRWRIETSGDGKTWRLAGEGNDIAERLVVGFAPRKARYVRITSLAAANPTYPTTFIEVEVFTEAPEQRPGAVDSPMLRCERALRALGALGGDGAAEAVLAVMRPYAKRTPGGGAFPERAMIHAGLRALGRLGGPEAGEVLVAMLRDDYWARYAADALGEWGSSGSTGETEGAQPVGFEEVVAALLDVYPDVARGVDGSRPKRCPRDDRTSFPSVDRMYETAFAVVAALSRLAPEDPASRARLRELAPQIVGNLPGDYDGGMFYEREAGQRATAHLLELAGMRRAAVEAAMAEFGRPADVPEGAGSEALAKLAGRTKARVPYAAAWLPALCDAGDAPRLTALLEHKDGWVRINAAKTLRVLGAREAAGRLAELLAASKPEGAYGYCKTFVKDEYAAPAPHWREAYARALGALGDRTHVPLLVKLLEDELNVLEVRYAAAMALDELGGPEAVAALKRCQRDHHYHSVRMIAREALWKRGLAPGPHPAELPAAEHPPTPTAPRRLLGPMRGIVFVRGPHKMPNCFHIDPWRQTYSTTDSGPTYRVGRNLWVLRPTPGGDWRAEPLTDFPDGWVADCEVSHDGRRIVFARRGEDDPWWHIWEIGPGGEGLRQLTRGPYHDVQPTYLPDGRIVFSSSRIGARDEYHGYLCTGLTVMGPDGEGIRCIGLNVGRDCEPAVLDDGRIAFNRLEIFYSRLKTEHTLQAVFPDGTRNVTLYGPERRAFWRHISLARRETWWGESGLKHRVLRLTQPQPFGRNGLLCVSSGGLTAVGTTRFAETILPHDKAYSVTSPYPLGDGRVLCAAGMKTYRNEGKKPGNGCDLGLYVVDAESGRMTELYNDPATAEFEPRPIAVRPRPPVLADDPPRRDYTGRLFCSSVRITQEARAAERGKLLRVIEGFPPVARHQTHTNPGEVWRNHAGARARILGTVPLAADGSFHVEVPADRLIHLQVLDSDRRVMGNQLIWMYVRPGETRSCVGCHENPDTTTLRTTAPTALSASPTPCLPTGGEFTYRAKAWRKTKLPDPAEERTRTARAINLMAR